MYMDVDPSNHESGLALERDTIVQAAAKIAAVLAQAPFEERPELVKAVDETLIDAGVAVIDTVGGDETERRGKHHPNITRPQLLAIIAAREERWRRRQSGRPTKLRGYM